MTDTIAMTNSRILSLKYTSNHIGNTAAVTCYLILWFIYRAWVIQNCLELIAHFSLIVVSDYSLPPNLMWATGTPWVPPIILYCDKFFWDPHKRSRCERIWNLRNYVTDDRAALSWDLYCIISSLGLSVQNYSNYTLVRSFKAFWMWGKAALIVLVTYSDSFENPFIFLADNKSSNNAITMFWRENLYLLMKR